MAGSQKRECPGGNGRGKMPGPKGKLEKTVEIKDRVLKLIEQTRP